MEPLQAMALASHGVVVEITAGNSWQSGTAGMPVILAYIATNSEQKLSFVSLQSAPRVADVLGLSSRPSYFVDMPLGVVIEMSLARPLAAGETVLVSLAQAGATTYYPPQPIDDGK